MKRLNTRLHTRLGAVLAALLGMTGALTSTAGATTVQPLTLAQQAQKAQVIVRATLGTATNATTDKAATAKDAGEVPYLVYPLTISETVQGDAASLPQQDGKPALYFLQGAQDLPRLSAGQEAYLLLYTGKMDSPLVGYNQGIYLIAADKVTGAGGSPLDPALTDPTKLRDAIRTALGVK